MKLGLGNPTLSTWFRRLLFWGPAFIPIVICGIVGAPYAKYLFAQQSVSQMAYDLTPPEYPGSHLINRWEGGGPTSAWDRRTYQTLDQVDSVRLFFQRYLPEFKPRERADVTGTLYESYVCNRSPEALQATRLIVDGHYPWYDKDENLPVPCVTVSIYSREADNQVQTIIEVWTDWPSD